MMNQVSINHKKRKLRWLAVAILTSVLMQVVPATGQETELDSIVIELRARAVKEADGLERKLAGRLLSIDESSVVVRTADGMERSIDRRWIKKLVINPTGGYLSPTYSQPLVSSSGNMLSRGEAYYRNQLIFFHQFAYGVSDNFELNLSFEAITLLAGLPAYLVGAKQRLFRGGNVEGALSVKANFAGGPNMIIAVPVTVKHSEKVSYTFSGGVVTDMDFTAPFFHSSIVGDLGPKRNIVGELYYLPRIGATAICALELRPRRGSYSISLGGSIFVFNEGSEYLGAPSVYVGLKVPLSSRY